MPDADFVPGPAGVTDDLGLVPRGLLSRHAKGQWSAVGATGPLGDERFRGIEGGQEVVMTLADDPLLKNKEVA
jgi:hypothetical protein